MFASEVAKSWIADQQCVVLIGELAAYNLNSYQLTTRIGQIGSKLKYEHTLVNGYVPHRSLINLKISIVNLTTLHILLHYLPRLQHR
ncbi:unnamed protein product, partial [Rotaria magnacalcarata]